MVKWLLILLFPLNALAGEVPDSVVSRLQKEQAFAYANDPSYWTTPKRETSWADELFFFLSNNVAIRWVAYGIVVLILLIIIYQVAKVNRFSFFTRTQKKINKEGSGIAELSLENIETSITEAIASGRYREGTRYLYLKTLIHLHEKNQITLHAKSTNNEYLQQMMNSASYADFARLTRIYEYVWYGEYQPGNEQFNAIHESFKSFISDN